MDLAIKMAKERSIPEGSVIAEPFLILVDDEKVMLTLAMSAWNIEIFPEEEREAKIEIVTLDTARGWHTIGCVVATQRPWLPTVPYMRRP